MPKELSVKGMSCIATPAAPTGNTCGHAESRDLPDQDKQPPNTAMMHADEPVEPGRNTQYEEKPNDRSDDDRRRWRLL